MPNSITIANGDSNLLRYNRGLDGLLCSVKKDAAESVWKKSTDSFSHSSDQEIINSIIFWYKIEPIKVGHPEIEAVKESGKNFVAYQNIPISGHIELLELKSAYSGSIPAGHVSSTTSNKKTTASIRVKVNIQGSVFDEPVDIYSEINETLRENTEAIYKIAEYVNKKVAEHNKILVDVIKPEIETRRRRLRNANISVFKKRDDIDTDEASFNPISAETDSGFIGVVDYDDYIRETSTEKKNICPLAKH